MTLLTMHRNFRYSQPDLANVAAANMTSTQSCQRRKRLLEARQSVLAVDEMDFWRGITADMMSDEEDGAVDGVSGWIGTSVYQLNVQPVEECLTSQLRVTESPSVSQLDGDTLTTASATSDGQQAC
ncbi:hypothetical protein KOW79_006691 [Hemibagrus wyckioides]|uniref:Uncharacterized protein n=1 Tax=Hemibagrus wyckioides TaxID=337641 RepID=A0A9D3SSR4_9TELE|nr:hypothetical protein KOW79_006691 [Hemibagrus wyckioides]